MNTLSVRLEVRLSPEAMGQLRNEAQNRGVSVAQLVREAIDLLIKEDRHVRMGAAEALFCVEAPAADWGAMKKEIEEARGGGKKP